MSPNMSQLIPKDPSSLMTIRSIHPQITTFSLPFSRVGLFAFGSRATLVRLSTGALAVFSPVALTPNVRTAISDLSSSPTPAVDYIIAPDAEHHLYISEWKRAFPSAKIIGPETLEAKRRHQAASGKSPHVDDDKFFKEIADANDTKIGDPAFDKEFDFQYFPSTPNKEIAFLHKPSRTLIQADLFFNFPGTEQYAKVPEDQKPKVGFGGLAAIGNWIFGKVGTTEGDLTWPRRFVWYGTAGKDKVGFARGIRRVDGWDFENVVPSHGDTMLGDGKERFRRLFAWHLHEKKE